MPQVSDYVSLITSEHAGAPRFVAIVSLLAQAMVDAQNALLGMPGLYDLDSAVGVQLDAVGLWVGISRNVAVPLAGVYFAFDTPGLGFDQGVWFGPFDPTTGVVSLDDDTYRLLLRAKIGANHWDGTLAQSAAILADIFATTSPGTLIFIQDNMDMTMTIGIAGTIPSALFLALLSGGYLPIKPAGVGIVDYDVTSVDGAPLFGWGVDTPYIAGWGTGAWATTL